MAVVHLYTSQTPGSEAGEEGELVVGAIIENSVEGKLVGLRWWKNKKDKARTSTTLRAFNATTQAELGSLTITHTTEAEGWQEGTFGSPITLAAGAKTAITVLLPKGFYKYTSALMSAKVTNGVLSSPATGGRFRYKTEGVPYPFPDNTSTAGFFVDFSFEEKGGKTEFKPPVALTKVIGTTSTRKQNWSAPAVTVKSSAPLPATQQRWPIPAPLVRALGLTPAAKRQYAAPVSVVKVPTALPTYRNFWSAAAVLIKASAQAPASRALWAPPAALVKASAFANAVARVWRPPAALTRVSGASPTSRRVWQPNAAKIVATGLSAAPQRRWSIPAALTKVSAAPGAARMRFSAPAARAILRAISPSLNLGLPIPPLKLPFFAVFRSPATLAVAKTVTLTAEVRPSTTTAEAVIVTLEAEPVLDEYTAEFVDPEVRSATIDS